MVTAVPLYQPWATLVVAGAKRIETRSWACPKKLIGERVVIYATKSIELGGESGLFDQCSREPFRSALDAAGAQFTEAGRRSRVILPRGALTGTLVIDRCAAMTREGITRLAELHPAEHAFGWYATGRFAWVLRDPVAFPEPIDWTSRQQGIFQVPAEVVGLAPPQETLPLEEAA